MGTDRGARAWHTDESEDRDDDEEIGEDHRNASDYDDCRA